MFMKFYHKNVFIMPVVNVSNYRHLKKCVVDRNYHSVILVRNSTELDFVFVKDCDNSVMYTQEDLFIYKLKD